MNRTAARVVTSLAASTVFLARKVAPDLLDTTDLVLLGLALLPWLTSLIKSAELPGGVKIEFQEVKDAVKKATSSAETAALKASVPSYLEVAESDPNLALVGLRIEIEKRMRGLARKHGINDRQSLSRLLGILREHGVLEDPVLSGFQELIMFGNQAAHGARVEPEAADWALQFGPKVLAVLDAELGVEGV